MNRFTPSFYKNYKRKFSLILILIFAWMITTSQQCTGNASDACGGYSVNLCTGYVRLSLVTNIPYGSPRPFTQGLIPYLPTIPFINICKSINSTPRTVFRTRVESYAMCNGIPRQKFGDCKTTYENCPTTNIADLQVMWNSNFKTKITITAISYYNLTASSGHMYYAIYEGMLDIEENVTSIPITTLNLTFYGEYREYQNFNIITDLCNNY